MVNCMYKNIHFVESVSLFECVNKNLLFICPTFIERITFLLFVSLYMHMYTILYRELIEYEDVVIWSS